MATFKALKFTIAIVLALIFIVISAYTLYLGILAAFVVGIFLLSRSIFASGGT